jgi:acyl carrier protein
MTEQQAIDLVNSSLVEEFELDPGQLVPEANLFTDLELDSLDMVDLVVVLEGAFEFKIRDEAALKEIRTIGDIHEFVIAMMRKLGV